MALGITAEYAIPMVMPMSICGARMVSATTCTVIFVMPMAAGIFMAMAGMRLEAGRGWRHCD